MKKKTLNSVFIIKEPRTELLLINQVSTSPTMPHKCHSNSLELARKTKSKYLTCQYQLNETKNQIKTRASKSQLKLTSHTYCTYADGPVKIS